MTIRKLCVCILAAALSLPAFATSSSAGSLGDRDLAIATLLYAQVAGTTCNQLSLNKPVRQAFMSDNGLAENDLSPTGAQWTEIEEALNELSALFREENEGACNTAWLLLGQSGYMASGMLIRPEPQKRAGR